MRHLTKLITLALWVLCTGSASSSLLEGFLHYDVDEYGTYYKNGHVYVLYVIKSYRKDWSSFDPIVGIEPGKNYKAHVFYLLNVNIHSGEFSQKEIYSTSNWLKEGLIYHMGMNAEGETYPLISVSAEGRSKKLLNKNREILFQYSEIFDARGSFIDDTVFYRDLEGKVCRYDFQQNKSYVIMPKHDYEALVGGYNYHMYNTDIPHFRAFSQYQTDTKIIDLLTGDIVTRLPSTSFVRIRMDGTNECWAINPDKDHTQVYLGEQMKETNKLKHYWWNEYLTVFDIDDGCAGKVNMWDGELGYALWFYESDEIVKGTLKINVKKHKGKYISSSIKRAQPAH